MAGAVFDPALPLRIHVVSQSPHTFAYKLWTARPQDASWTPLDEGTIDTPAKDYGPFPAATKLAYTLLIGGNPHTDWRTQVRLSQCDVALKCTPDAETGTTNDNGVARRDASVTLQ